eukprot:m.135114 g.135114  ORF g.135114 m.135114 type:complete len:52 (-) comp15985_c0_seq36:63-218(-)
MRWSDMGQAPVLMRFNVGVLTTLAGLATSLQTKGDLAKQPIAQDARTYLRA